MRPGRFLLRTALTGLHRLRLVWWRVRGRRGRGALALPLTPKGKLVLVRLSYTGGWRLPGGGIGRAEDARTAALRELSEEIGMTAHGEVACVDELRWSTLFLVRDVVYAPRSSIEIEEVAEFAPDTLPQDATRITRRCVAEAMPLILKAV